MVSGNKPFLNINAFNSFIENLKNFKDKKLKEVQFKND